MCKPFTSLRTRIKSVNVMDHRYELERYKGMRSRYECPVCHHKGVFVRYIDTETGLYLSPEVGRCNREDKCGYHYTPKQYFDSHPTERPEANIIRHPKHITAPKSIDTILLLNLWAMPRILCGSCSPFSILMYWNRRPSCALCRSII